MGAQISTLSIDDADELIQETGFTESEIQRLYKRFTLLDRDDSGTLNSAELFAIPEFAMNPLSKRMFALFQLEQLGQPHQNYLIPEDVEIDFRSFVKTLAVFSPHASEHDKIRFAFNIYSTNLDGPIKRDELVSALHCMVGDQMSTKELHLIIDRALADCSPDSTISFDMFSQIMRQNNLTDQMQISF